DFQDSPDDEEDTRNSQEYLKDLEEEYQERALLPNPSQEKPELRPNKDFEVKYNKVKAKLALLSSGTLSKSVMVKNKGLVAEAYEWDEEDVSSNDNEMIEVKVLMVLADDESIAVGKESARNGEWVKITMKKVHTLLDMEDNDERKSFLDYLFAITDSSATEYDAADESLVCSTPLPLLEKLVGAEPVSGPKTIKSILKSNSTFKAKTLKGVTLNEPSSAPAKGNKKGSASKNNSAPAGKLKVISLKRGTKPRNPQHINKSCETSGSTVHITTDHNDIEWFKRGEALQAKKAEAFQSSNATRSKTPTKSGCLRHMNGVKSYMHIYVEQPGPKVVYGDDSTCTTKCYGSIKCNGIVFIEVNGLKYNLVSISQLCVESSHSFRRSTSKDIKSKNSILKNTKSSSTYVWKTLDSACLDSNKSNTKTSNVCQTNACISNSKTVKACVNVVKDGSNIVCISYVNDVFLNSHEKCVARPSLSRKSSVKRALFTSPLAAKSTNLGATSIVTKSRLSVAKTPTATSKVSTALTTSSDSRTTRTLSSYMNNKIATSRKWQKWFEYQHGFN
ncbi:hypothetical protein Tco_1313661, partial [Tanacetum coccineum]